MKVRPMQQDPKNMPTIRIQKDGTNVTRSTQYTNRQKDVIRDEEKMLSNQRLLLLTTLHPNWRHLLLQLQINKMEITTRKNTTL